jgi:hypothetical protein
MSDDTAAVSPDALLADSLRPDENSGKRISRSGVIGWIVALSYLALCGILYGLT